MAAEASGDLVRIDQVQGVCVVRFNRRTILDPLAIAAVGERLLALASQTARCSLVLDFASVESLPSGMMGNFVALRQAVLAAGGRLAFCNVDAFLRHIFAICNVPRDIPVYEDEAAAVKALLSEGQGPTG
jgi:anti-anti-sigma factor